jgi:hypothetical protein
MSDESAWARRGFQRSVRLRLGGDLLEWNGCYLLGLKKSMAQLVKVIHAQRPSLEYKDVEFAVLLWHNAMYDSREGTAEYGRGNV